MTSSRPTPAMLRAMVSARDRGSLTAHLRGNSEWGGFVATQQALAKRYWIKRSTGELTPGGLEIVNRYSPAAALPASAGSD